jgi:hypothetical protein
MLREGFVVVGMLIDDFRADNGESGGNAGNELPKEERFLPSESEQREILFIKHIHEFISDIAVQRDSRMQDS